MSQKPEGRTWAEQTMGRTNKETDHAYEAGRISAIQSDGMRIEYTPPDTALAYANLAPLVTAARAHLSHGDNEKAMAALDEAFELIGAVRTQSTTIQLEEKADAKQSR